MNPLIVSHDSDTLPFDRLGTLLAVARSVRHKQSWHWNNKGLVGVLTPEVMGNALDIFTAYIRQKHRRVAIPNHAGRFFWGQTVPLKHADQSLQPGPTDEAASRGEANH